MTDTKKLIERAKISHGQLYHLAEKASELQEQVKELESQLILEESWRRALLPLRHSLGLPINTSPTQFADHIMYLANEVASYKAQLREADKTVAYWKGEYEKSFAHNTRTYANSAQAENPSACSEAANSPSANPADESLKTWADKHDIDYIFERAISFLGYNSVKEILRPSLLQHILR